MAVDQNTYALSMQITLQDQVTEATRKIWNDMSNIETKASKLNADMNKFGTTTEQASTKITDGFKKASVMMKAFFGDQAAKAQLATKNIAEIEADVARMSNREQQSLRVEKLRARIDVEKKKGLVAFEKILGRVWKGEKLSHKELKNFRPKEIEHYEKVQKAKLLEQQLDKTAKTTDEKGLQRKADLEAIVGSIGDAFKRTFGNIAAAATAGGLFDRVVLASGKRAEEFHTINYRNVGTMNDLNEEMLKLGKTGTITTEEWVASTKALRELGASREEIDGLRESVSKYSRISGADVKTTAKYSTVLNRTTKDRQFAAKQISVMSHYQKEAGFTGEEMNAIMEQTTKDALFMGSTGSQGISDYNNALLRGAAAAKSLGRPIHEATDLIKAMQDPLSTVAVLGPESLDWDFKKRSNELAKWAKDAEKELSGLSGEAAFLKRKQIQAMLSAGGIAVDYGDIEAKLKIMQGQIDKDPLQAKLEMPAKDPIGELNKQIDDAQGAERKRQLVESRTLAELEEKFKFVRESYEKLLDLFLGSPIAQSIAVWGTALMGVGGVFASAYRLIRGGLGDLISDLGSVAKWSIRSFGTMIEWAGSGASALAGWAGKAGAAIASWASTAGTAISTWAATATPTFAAWASAATASVTSFFGATAIATTGLGLLGQAAAVVGAAFVGWKIGSAIEKTLDFSGAVDRAARGQATWGDVIKNAINPVGLLSVGLSKLMQWYDKVADAEGRAAAATRAHLKDAVVEQKLALQTQFADASKRNDRAAMESINKQLDDVREAEQKSYEETAAYKAIVEQSRLAQQKDASQKASEDMAKTAVDAHATAADKQVAIAQNASETIAENQSAAMKNSIDKLNADLKTQTDAMKNTAVPGALEDMHNAHRTMNNDIAEGQKQVKTAIDATKKMADPLKAGLEDTTKVAQAAITAGKELQNSVKPPQAAQAAQAEKKVSKLDEETSQKKRDRETDIALRQMAAQTNQIYDNANRGFESVNKNLLQNSKETEPKLPQDNKPLAPETKALDKMNDAAKSMADQAKLGQEMRAETVATPQPPARPDEIVTVKMDNQTARDEKGVEADRFKAMLNVAYDQVAGLKEILAKISGKEVAEIKDLVKQYLPEIAQEADSGLASTVNQWMY